MYQTVEQYAEELSNCRISRSKYNNKQAKMLQWLIDS